MATPPIRGRGGQDWERWSTIGRALHSVVTSTKAVAGEVSIDSSMQRCDGIVELDMRIEMQSKEIEVLKEEAKSRENTHKVAAKEGLRTYRASLDEMESKVNESNMRAKKLSDELASEVEIVRVLRSENSTLADVLRKAEGEFETPGRITEEMEIEQPSSRTGIESQPKHQRAVEEEDAAARKSEQQACGRERPTRAGAR